MRTYADPPRERLADAAAELGASTVAGWCADLLLGRVAFDDPEQPDLEWLGGRHARAELDRGDMQRRHQEYWVRVWAARGLRYVWVPEAARAIVHGLADPAWRVREMCAKVARQREIGEAADALAALVDDETPRVRAAAIAALGAVGEAEHAPAVHAAERDPEAAVSGAAYAAIASLRRRLDRPV
jgi:hypothetical protein